MKKILFPATNRVHLARQKLLLEELKKLNIEVDVQQYELNDEMPRGIALIQAHFHPIFEKGNYDAVLIRGDRYEMLPLAYMAAVRKIPIIHIEGGDVSGAIDDKVRNAISMLADLHFPTNKQSRERLVSFGIQNEKIFNYGSLDCEIAANNNFEIAGEFALMLYHPMEGEDVQFIKKLVQEIIPYNLVWIKSNHDNGEATGSVELTPEDYLSHIKSAKLLIGNSSSFIKEASIYGTPVVLIGDRQKGRMLPENVKNVPYNPKAIIEAVEEQLNHGRYNSSDAYYKQGTSEMIAITIKDFLSK